MLFPAGLRDAVTWDGVDSVLCMFTATRDSTAPLPAAWPHGEWCRPGIIMELEPEDERGDGLHFYAYDLKLSGFPDDVAGFLTDLVEAVGSPRTLVTWLAFEGLFHFDDLFDADFARQVYASRVGSDASEFALTTAERRSPAWADHVSAVRPLVSRGQTGERHGLPLPGTT